MRRWSASGAFAGVTLVLGLCGFLYRPGKVFGFTQGVKKGNAVVPMGHEWITRLAAVELFDSVAEKDSKEPKEPKDPNDPRNKDWISVKTNLSLEGAMTVVEEIKGQKSDDSYFKSRYLPIYDAILGERWVDIGGVNFAKASLPNGFDEKYNCIDQITQEPPEVQYDHFMRQPEDIDGQGGVKAAKASRERFVEYFVAAAMAKDGKMRVWDGGAFATEQNVDRHYFLFGRALHLLEDSFSADHTVRIKQDGYKRVRQVKSYLCAYGSEQHSHKKPWSLPAGSFYETGDVIWDRQSDLGNYKPSNMKPLALAATEATKEAWAGFIRAMAAPRDQRESKAQKEANAIVSNWMSIDETEMLKWYEKPEHRDDTYVQASAATESSWGGTTQVDCMKRDWDGSTQDAKLKEFEKGRRVCIYNMVPIEGTENDRDRRLHIPFLWNWRKVTSGGLTSFVWQNPPKGFEVGEVDSGKLRITLINKHRQAPLCGELPALRLDNDNKKCTPLQLAVDGGNLGNTQIEAVDLPGHSFGEEEGTHRARLYTKGRSFSFIRRPDGYYNIRVKNHDGKDGNPLHSTDGYPVFTSVDPDHESALWQVSGLPEFDLANGLFHVTAVVEGAEHEVVTRREGAVFVGRETGTAGTIGVFRLSGERGVYTMQSTDPPSPVNLRVNRQHSAQRLIAGSGPGDAFRVYSPLGDGIWYIQVVGGGYWWTKPGAESPIDTNAALPCGGTPDHSVLSGNGDGCDKNTASRGPRPTLFRLQQLFR